MNIEFSKIKTPFHPDHQQMSDLAARIQKKVGIEAQELFEKPELKEPVIPRNPVQLSVEFGNSFVSESMDDTYIETDVQTEVQEVEDTNIHESLESSVPTKEEPKNELVESQFIEKLSIEEKSPLKQTDETIDEPTAEELEAEKIRSAEVERKRAEAAARYAALLDESRSDYIPISNQVPEKETKGLPWASILGVVASFAAIATAWWVWSLIQAPMSIEQVAEKSRISAASVTPVVAVSNSSVNNKEESLVELDELPTGSQLVADMIFNDNNPTSSVSLPHFTNMDEQSKVSMVELENNGLVLMELEDEIFSNEWL